MFTSDDLRNLLRTQPFTPFRLLMSNGGKVVVRTPEVVLPGRRCAVIGLLDENVPDGLFDRWAVVWYIHVTRVEMLLPGAPPFTQPQTGPAGTPSPSPV
jgi:hypothetical protein